MKNGTNADEPRPGTTRLSASFYGVVIQAGSVRAGADLWPTIQLTTGRGGADIQRSTIERWKDAGLVEIKTRKPRDGEHHLAVPIVAVRLTRDGLARVRRRQERELSRQQAAA